MAKKGYDDLPEPLKDLLKKAMKKGDIVSEKEVHELHYVVLESVRREITETGENGSATITVHSNSPLSSLDLLFDYGRDGYPLSSLVGVVLAGAQTGRAYGAPGVVTITIPGRTKSFSKEDYENLKEGDVEFKRDGSEDEIMIVATKSPFNEKTLISLVYMTRTPDGDLMIDDEYSGTIGDAPGKPIGKFIGDEERIETLFAAFFTSAQKALMSYEINVAAEMLKNNGEGQTERLFTMMMENMTGEHIEL